MIGLKKVVLLGSGGLSIGQAGEFDYSGCQAIQSLEEEGIEVIIINPNIATVQTTPRNGRKVYLYPVEPEWVEKIIAEEKPDGIIAGFGGQTALNCIIQLYDAGILDKYFVRNLGTPIEVLRLTEDRDLFAKKMIQHGIPVPPSRAVTQTGEALQAAEEIGYPVISRSAFALGGLGSGFAHHPVELEQLVKTALATSPQVLIERSLRGWKEVEYEVMRDAFGNAIAICNMENLDPLGIHTGDSIVVAPSQTLTDDEFQLLRSTSLKIVELMKVVGECNIQFALNPKSHEFYVIEMNARLSRSSALASKATGYPIAFIAAKVILGKSLLQIKNPLTSTTTAYFEPALDYITVKIPRWDLKKFKGVSRNIGTTMKSIGEVMGIGRSFAEALQKSIRMVTEDEAGLGKPLDSKFDLGASDTRLFHIIHALRQGSELTTLFSHTQIDPWFLHQLFEIVQIEKEISEFMQKNQKSNQRGAFINILLDLLPNLSPKQLRKWKVAGFSDEQIAQIWFRLNFPEQIQIPKSEILEASLLIRESRKSSGIVPAIKKIDTSAAEFPSYSNYLYLTYGGQCSDDVARPLNKKTAILLGGGSYRIGSSVEFDWCGVSTVEKLRDLGWSTVVINFNPETVSTDFNACDRLYFEELTLERILDIIEFENPQGLILSMSGQLPNKLAPRLAKLNIPLLGHPWESIDGAEDREKFSALLDTLGILQPRWVEAKSPEILEKFIDEVGYPILVRPSYVLSGAAMNVAVNHESLEHFRSLAQDLSPEHPIILSQYFEEAKEVELDAVAKNGKPLVMMLSEHIENAGIHSGDATLVFPPQNLSEPCQQKIKKIGSQIAEALRLNGPFNIQFLIKNEEINVIECNVRASRSFPFVSKVSGINMIHLATDVMITPSEIRPLENFPMPPYVGVKSAMFSFQRLSGADPVLGVEMASTGEVACLGSDLSEAIVLSFQSSGIRPPKKGVLISAGRIEEKHKLLYSVQILREMQIPIYATPGTALFLQNQGHPVEEIDWHGITSTLAQLIQNGKIDFVINIPKNYSRTELSNGYQVRMIATQTGCTLMTNVEKISVFLHSITSASLNSRTVPLLALSPTQFQ